MRRCLAWGLAGLLAAGGGCGEGLSDGLGELSVIRVVEPPGPTEVALAQARLIFGSGTIAKRATIKMRRLPAVQPAGPIGPVFEVTVDGGATFTGQSPVIEISVSTVGTVPEEALVIAYHGGGATDYQWNPLTSSRKYVPERRAVSGDVTVSLPGRTLRFGMLAWCGNSGPRVEKCPVEGQACPQGACQ